MSTKKPFSYIRGYSFSFEDEGNKIEAWFSSFSGLEKVFINGELVSKQRSYSKNSSNSFKVANNEYSMNMTVKSLLKGPFVCTLIKNGKAYKRQKLVFVKLRDMFQFKDFFNWRYFILAIILGIVLATLTFFAGLPDLVAIVIIIVSVSIFFLFESTKKPIARVEDEDIV